MGEKEFTFKLDGINTIAPNENISTKVDVPRWEYARLIRASEKLRIATQLWGNLDSYDMKKVFDVMFKETCEDEGD